MLAAHIVYRVKKKSLSTVFKYGNQTNELSISNKGWLSISKGSSIKPTKEMARKCILKWKKNLINSMVEI